MEFIIIEAILQYIPSEKRSGLVCDSSIILILQTLVVQTLDSAIQWINIYPVESATSFPNTYPQVSDLSNG